jgi:hypothetical protein
VKLLDGRTKELDDTAQYNVHGAAGSTSMLHAWPREAPKDPGDFKSGTSRNLILANLASKNKMPHFRRPAQMRECHIANVPVRMNVETWRETGQRHCTLLVA